jgi:thiamine-monophosphate kinase
MESREPVLRSGAEVGDLVAVGGTLGRAACGLSLLETENPELVRAYDEFVNIQKRPEPPLALGKEAADAGATSMLDISDGLAKDATRIAKASGVSINLHRQLLQGFEATLESAALALGVDTFAWVISGGEDHSLLATFPKEATIPRAFKVIGEVVATKDESLMVDEKPFVDMGWDSVRGVTN